mmetsp:Transcript_4489/g.8618  ORF Transcript_4489/g.8618 Transcript_4489/m.8618 type:complete len:110 (+) Transcript_4489:146-475(+)
MRTDHLTLFVIVLQIFLRNLLCTNPLPTVDMVLSIHSSVVALHSEISDSSTVELLRTPSSAEEVFHLDLGTKPDRLISCRNTKENHRRVIHSVLKNILFFLHTYFVHHG